MKTQKHFSQLKFEDDLEQQFWINAESKARPLVAFIYWIGGILPLIFMLNDYFNAEARFNELFITRSVYMCFWAAITFATLSKWRFISLSHSMLIYISVGMLYVPYLNAIVSERPELVVPSVLFYLFGIVICQLGARLALYAGLASCVVPSILFISHNQLNKNEINIIFMLAIWSIATWVASLILERINRRLFLYEHDLNHVNKINQDLLKKEAQANRFKSEFLAQMSHEIRTPLTAILGYAESYFSDNLSKETKESTVKTIHKNGEHLLSLVNDILDLSKIEAGKLQLESIDSEWLSIAEQVQETQQNSLAHKDVCFNLSYQYPLPSHIQTDPTRLKQILFNLTTNAIKFTPKGQINLDISYDNEHKKILFVLKDSGIGMSQQVCDNLFKAYQQADSSINRTYGGTGLGLYISKQLIELLGGSIRVESIPKQGTIFYFSIAAHLSQQHTQITNATENKSNEIPNSLPSNNSNFIGHVLVAEDNIDNRKLIKLKLEQIGLTVSTAEQGEQAVEKALLEDFDLILMDIQMPIMSGEEALKIIKATDADIPIVALTANAMSQDIQRYLSLGFDAHIAKPIEQIHFINVIKQFCQSHTESAVTKQATLEPSAPNQDTLFSLDNSAFRALVYEYIDSLPCEIEMLKHAKKNHDWQKLAKVAHNIKGSAGNFGFTQVSSDASEVEQLIKSDHLGEIDRVFSQLLESLNQALYSREN
ncbi:hybrid sensor histidine kinase/response regulator [Algibacillus agarilyticus]|uniref:hybrid sensor histidine kinase/response regulator n=1 Tax=Algibacillus agarilyticus TaxID=2234133 RepID=UPI000DD048DC|nr:hybrid sensor histidine kinase/response regulator [Algibacillus agarilyticus]